MSNYVNLMNSLFIDVLYVNYWSITMNSNNLNVINKS